MSNTSNNSNSNNTSNTPADYLSYLLRLRCVPGAEGHRWQASLDEPITQEVFRFEDLQSLFAFLLAQTGQDHQETTIIAP